MREQHIDECKVIQQNSTYSAEAHHQIATRAKRAAFWLEVVPAVCAAGTSALVAAGIAGTDLLPVTVLSGAITAVTAVLNPNKRYQEHLDAAKGFTSLKHDARFLGSAQAARLTDEAFAVAVENLHARYNDFLRAVPPTDERGFKTAQATIAAGVHEPDRTSAGTIR